MDPENSSTSSFEDLSNFNEDNDADKKTNMDKDKSEDNGVLDIIGNGQLVKKVRDFSFLKYIS